MNKLLPFLLLILIVGVGGFWFVNNQESSSSVSDLPETIAEVTQQPKSDEQLIEDALVAKHGWDPTDIVVTVTANDGQYAAGGIAPAEGELGGGGFFAAKIDGVWQIVWDGNGSIFCDDLTDYPDFPVELIPECYDRQTAEVIAR